MRVTCCIMLRLLLLLLLLLLLQVKCHKSAGCSRYLTGKHADSALQQQQLVCW
jgi:hypothetical protein